MDELQGFASTAHDLEAELNRLGVRYRRRGIEMDVANVEFQGTPDGGVVLALIIETTEGAPGIAVVEIELTAAQLAVLSGYAVGAALNLKPKYSQAYADERVINYCLDPERGVPPGGFLSQLIDAILQADPGNQERLALGFPAFVNAVQRFKNGELK